jgi:hypothetical protein
MPMTARGRPPTASARAQRGRMPLWAIVLLAAMVLIAAAEFVALALHGRPGRAAAADPRVAPPPAAAAPGTAPAAYRSSALYST